MNSKLIRQWLDKEDRSVAWLARQIDRPRVTLNQWLNRESDIPVSVALKISEITGLDVRQLCAPVAS